MRVDRLNPPQWVGHGSGYHFARHTWHLFSARYSWRARLAQYACPELRPLRFTQIPGSNLAGHVIRRVKLLPGARRAPEFAAYSFDRQFEQGLSSYSPAILCQAHGSTWRVRVLRGARLYLPGGL